MIRSIILRELEKNNVKYITSEESNIITIPYKREVSVVHHILTTLQRYCNVNINNMDMDAENFYIHLKNRMSL